MWGSPLADWQQKLVTRLERGIGRALTPVDVESVAWDWKGRSMTVQTFPLLGELRAHGLISNVFRSPPLPRATY